jgi:CRP-like cAMP-binding protein
MFIPGNISLFEGIRSEEIVQLLSCLGVHNRTFMKGETVINEGDLVESIGVILTGFIQIVRNDANGSRMILASFGAGSIFAESFVCAGIVRSPVCVSATEASDILFIPFKKMIRSCASSCNFHNQLIENMMKLIARKNLLLNAKIEIAGKRTIREKVAAYLEQERQKNRSSEFDIPFSRNELADFLCVDRSALSREMGKMKGEGILLFKRNRFSLLKNMNFVDK